MVIKGFNSILFLILLPAFFIACRNKPSKQDEHGSTPTSGEMTIVVDESVAPVILNAVNTFEAIYNEANIHVSIKAEPEAITDLLNDSVQLIVIARMLNPDELQFIQQSDYAPRQIRIAIDAVAFLVNLQNPDSNLKYLQMLDILSGRITDWKSINPTSSLGKISLIFNDNRSGIIRYLKDDVLKNDSLTPNAFALDSNSAVIDYVEKNPSAIGVIGVSWICETGDTVAESFLRSIRIAGITGSDSTATALFYRPGQATLMRRQYPFFRDVYLISREEGVGLGTGFVKYMITDEGQTIIRLFGLVPAHPTERTIELKNEF